MLQKFLRSLSQRQSDSKVSYAVARTIQNKGAAKGWPSSRSFWHLLDAQPPAILPYLLARSFSSGPWHNFLATAFRFAVVAKGLLRLGFGLCAFNLFKILLAAARRKVAVQQVVTNRTKASVLNGYDIARTS